MLRLSAIPTTTAADFPLCDLLMPNAPRHGRGAIPARCYQLLVVALTEAPSYRLERLLSAA